MQKYIEELKKLDKEGSNELISNSSEERATELITQLLANAKNNVNIVSAKLSLYNNPSVIEALKTALANKVTVNLLLDNYPDSGIDKKNNFLKICQQSKNCIVETMPNQLNAHIITRDGVAFRYSEIDGFGTAVGSFNYPIIAKNADEKVFGVSGLFNNSAPSADKNQTAKEVQKTTDTQEIKNTAKRPQNNRNSVACGISNPH